MSQVLSHDHASAVLEASTAAEEAVAVTPHVGRGVDALSCHSALEWLLNRLAGVGQQVAVYFQADVLGQPWHHGLVCAYNVRRAAHLVAYEVGG